VDFACIPLGKGSKRAALLKVRFVAADGCPGSRRSIWWWLDRIVSGVMPF
jgi:hypothetical protein